MIFEIFEQWKMADSPNGQLPTNGLQIIDADPPINETPPVDEVTEAMSRLRGGMETGTVTPMRSCSDPEV